MVAWISTNQKNFAVELERQVRDRTNELKGRNNELIQQKEFAETILDTSIDITIVYDTELRFRVFNKGCGGQIRQVAAKK